MCTHTVTTLSHLAGDDYTWLVLPSLPAGFAKQHVNQIPMQHQGAAPGLHAGSQTKAAVIEDMSLLVSLQILWNSHVCSVSGLKHRPVEQQCYVQRSKARHPVLPAEPEGPLRQLVRQHSNLNHQIIRQHAEAMKTVMTSDPQAHLRLQAWDVVRAGIGRCISCLLCRHCFTAPNELPQYSATAKHHECRKCRP